MDFQVRCSAKVNLLLFYCSILESNLSQQQLFYSNFVTCRRMSPDLKKAILRFNLLFDWRRI